MWLTITWSIVLIVVFVMNRSTGRIMLGWKRMKEGFHLKSKLEIGLLMVMGAIAAITFSGCGCRTFEQC